MNYNCNICKLEFLYHRKKKFCSDCSTKRRKDLKNSNRRTKYKNDETYKNKRLTDNLKWRENNPDKVKRGRKNYYKNNKHKILERVKHRYYKLKNSGTRMFLEIQYRYRHTEYGRQKTNERTRRRRMKKKKLRENFTTQEWRDKLTSTKGMCKACNKYVGEEHLTLDHILPISIAPTDFIYTINDIQPLCGPCNSGKGDRVM